MSAPLSLGKYDLWELCDVEFVESDGLVYGLTECCQASATGTDDGTACRSCYEPVADSLGSCWTVAEFDVYLERTGQRK
jgi:hypothetical protein